MYAAACTPLPPPPRGEESNTDRTGAKDVSAGSQQGTRSWVLKIYMLFFFFKGNKAIVVIHQEAK